MKGPKEMHTESVKYRDHIIDVVVDAVTTLKGLELIPDNGFPGFAVTPANVLVDQAQFSAGVHQ